MNQSIKSIICQHLKECVDEYLGQPIEAGLLHAINLKARNILAGYVAEGHIDSLKWHNDHEITVTKNETSPYNITINFPKWLKDWLDEEI